MFHQTSSFQAACWTRESDIAFKECNWMTRSFTPFETSCCTDTLCHQKLSKATRTVSDSTPRRVKTLKRDSARSARAKNRNRSGTSTRVMFVTGQRGKMHDFLFVGSIPELLGCFAPTEPLFCFDLFVSHKTTLFVLVQETNRSK